MYVQVLPHSGAELGFFKSLMKLQCLEKGDYCEFQLGLLAGCVAAFFFLVAENSMKIQPLDI